MHKFNSFIVYTDSSWEYNEKTPNLESVQVHCIGKNQGIGIIKMKKKISLKDASNIFINKNNTIIPVLNESQYVEYNNEALKFEGVKDRIKFYNSWFKNEINI